MKPWPRVVVRACPGVPANQPAGEAEDNGQGRNCRTAGAHQAVELPAPAPRALETRQDVVQQEAAAQGWGSSSSASKDEAGWGNCPTDRKGGCPAQSVNYSAHWCRVGARQTTSVHMATNKWPPIKPQQRLGKLPT